MSDRSQQGFTLTELMITVAIVAIIAAIAVPSYSQFTKRAHLRDAQAALMENAHALEQFYAQNHNFGTVTGTGTTVTRPNLAKSATNHFNIVLADTGVCSDSPKDGDHYCMIASAKNPSSEPRVLVLTETGKIQLCAQNSNDDSAKCEVY